MGKAYITHRRNKKILRKDTTWETGVNAMTILKWILNKKGRRVHTRFILLRTETSGGLLWTRK
jgi:hypothetical protein